MTEDDVAAIYIAILKRRPESPNVINNIMSNNSLITAISRLLMSQEYKKKILLQHFTDCCVNEQMGPWFHKKISLSQLMIALDKEHANSQSFYNYEIKNNFVTFIEKSNPHPVFRERASIYKDMIQLAIKAHPLQQSLNFGIDVNDEAEERVDYPVMSFQKKAGERNILLPDFEFHTLDYLASFPIDRLATSDKLHKAFFSGSTTGKLLIDINDVILRSTPRLRAAYYFRDCESVDFFLPSLVQCTPDAETLLRDDGFGVNSQSWETAFKSKFLISLDGNGATCSRPVIIMNSKSILIKYESPFILYWTNHAIPWIHYIPVKNESEILDILKSDENFDRYSYIATMANNFVDCFFNKESVLMYVYQILNSYKDLVVDE